MREALKIIADGPFSPREKQYWIVRARLFTEARRRRAEDFKKASFLEQIRLEWEIRCEVSRELKRMFPPGALYAASEAARNASVLILWAD